MFIDKDTGLIIGAEQIASPNFDDRPEGVNIELLVIHNISLPPGEFGGQYVAQFFTNLLDPQAHPYFMEIASMQVSSHLFIRRDGALIQFVPLHRRAWHAGASQFQGRSRCNDFSIGIEMEGTDTDPYTEAQYVTLAEVTRLLQQAYPALGQGNIVGHCDISPGRKTDPGQAFNWGRYLQDVGLPDNS